MRLHLILGVAGIGAALVIGIGAKQYLFPPMKASQVKVSQSNLGIGQSHLPIKETLTERKSPASKYHYGQFPTQAVSSARTISH